jgi:hypothetical protein
MVAFPCFIQSSSERPANLVASAERLSGVSRLGYNIVHEGERTGLVAIIPASFERGMLEPLAAGFAGGPGEEGA